jgi:succinoglycan biosynthesis transport protein ExoP
MSLIQFVRILWARRWIIFLTTVSCVAGAAIVTLILPPRWEASSRVLLNLLRPDPVSGSVIAINATRVYVASQIELIQDFSVASQVVNQLGWPTDPEMIQLYRQRPANDGRDFTQWAAQMVIDRTKANVVEGSNILEITYMGTSAEQARTVADALRKSYVETSLSFRRDEANRNADWFTIQAEKAKGELDAVEAEKTKYERDNGIVMQDDKTDMETARLRALLTVRDAAFPIVSGVTPSNSTANLQLAQIDAEIAQKALTLGPNHPELQGLQAKRSAIEGLIAKDRATTATSGAAASSAYTSGVGSLDRAVEAQRAKVIGERGKLGRLAQLQAEVDLRRDMFNKTAGRAAEFRQEGAIGDAGLMLLGSAVAPTSPVFPNKRLIYMGSFGLGLAMGVLLALLMELLRRRIRGVEDMQLAADVPVLAVIPPPVRRYKVPRRKARISGADIPKMHRA